MSILMNMLANLNGESGKTWETYRSMKKKVFDVYDYQEQNKSVFIEHGVAVNK